MKSEWGLWFVHYSFISSYSYWLRCSLHLIWKSLKISKDACHYKAIIHYWLFIFAYCPFTIKSIFQRTWTADLQFLSKHKCECSPNHQVCRIWRNWRITITGGWTCHKNNLLRTGCGLLAFCIGKACDFLQPVANLYACWYDADPRMTHSEGDRAITDDTVGWEYHRLDAGQKVQMMNSHSLLTIAHSPSAILLYFWPCLIMKFWSRPTSWWVL